jgi:hypothetical protein
LLRIPSPTVSVGKWLHVCPKGLGSFRAVAGRKVEATAPVRVYALAGAGRRVDDGLSLWGRLASVVPMVVLAAGLVTIHVIQNDVRASEIAEVDAALLTDDLPPEAYADPGFLRFLKSTE